MGATNRAPHSRMHGARDADNRYRGHPRRQPRTQMDHTTHKVLHLIPSFGLGGAECLTAEIAAAQQRQGLCQPFVFAWHHDGPVHDRLRVSHVAALAVESRRRSGISCLLLVSDLVARALAIARTVLSRHTEIIHAHMCDSGAIALLVGRFLRRAVVVTEHSPSPFPPQCHPGSLEYAWRSFILGWTYQHVDAVIAVSAEIAEVLRDRFGVPGAKLRTIISGTPSSSDRFGDVSPRLPDGLEHGTRRITCVGRLVASKNQAALIRTLPRLVVEHPPLRLVLVGDGPDQGVLEELAESLGIRRHVIFLGARTDVSAILRASDCFVTASLHEGTSVALLEAMEQGLPVVATFSRGNAAVLEDGAGWIVDADAPDKLAAAISAVLLDPELANTLSAAARNSAQHYYTLDRVIRELQTLYDEVGTRRDGQPLPALRAVST